MPTFTKPFTVPFTDEQLKAAMTNATIARAYAVGADPKTAVAPAGLPWCREFVRAVLNAAGVQECAEVERIRDLPEVDEALLNFKDDCTGDNAAMIVRAV